VAPPQRLNGFSSRPTPGPGSYRLSTPAPHYPQQTLLCRWSATAFDWCDDSTHFCTIPQRLRLVTKRHTFLCFSSTLRTIGVGRGAPFQRAQPLCACFFFSAHLLKGNSRVESNDGAVVMLVSAIGSRFLPATKNVTRQGKARQGRARQGKARQCGRGCGRARHCSIRATGVPILEMGTLTQRRVDVLFFLDTVAF
jgi:hypothetical protein